MLRNQNNAIESRIAKWYREARATGKGEKLNEGINTHAQYRKQSGTDAYNPLHEEMIDSRHPSRGQ